MTTRRQAREQAFILIFEKAFQQDCTVDDIVAYAVESCFFEPDEYSVALAKKVEECEAEIDEKIAPCLKKWTVSRIPRVARSILKLAVCEMLYFEDVPVSVSINEAVELCKTYASKEDASFVNGVLGTISRSGEEKSEE